MNLFCVREGTVLAPMESAALGGITRKNVLDVARELGIPVVETDLTAYDAICADEVFVTSSLEGVAAVGSVDGRRYEPVPGSITHQVRTAYVNRAVAEATPIPSIDAFESGRGGSR